MRPKAWIYGREPGNTGALQVKQMLDRRSARGKEKIAQDKPARIKENQKNHLTNSCEIELKKTGEFILLSTNSTIK